MDVKLIKDVKEDLMVRNYDYKVFKVKDQRRNALIFEHNRVFYNLYNRNPFGSIETAFKDLY